MNEIKIVLFQCMYMVFKQVYILIIYILIK